MIRNAVLLATSITALIATVNVANAQAAQPFSPFGQRIQVPKIEGLPPELQQEFDQIQRELDQVFNQVPGQPNRTRPVNAMKWGGMQLKKITAAEQEKLGLPDNEGLVVTAVDANSTAAQAGLKANDILVKVNNKAVASDPNAFAKFVKDQNAVDPIDLVVLREGKEETIKGAKMPAVVQLPTTGRPLPALGGFGGLQIRPMMVPDRLNPRIPFQNGLLGKPQNMDMQMVINGAKITKKQNGDDFSGTYAKGDVRMKVAGKWDNGVARTSEIVVQVGEDVNKYKALNDVPVEHRATVQQLMPATINNFLFPFELLRDLENMQGFEIPGLDN